VAYPGGFLRTSQRAGKRVQRGGGGESTALWREVNPRPRRETQGGNGVDDCALLQGTPGPQKTALSTSTPPHWGGCSRLAWRTWAGVRAGVEHGAGREQGRERERGRERYKGRPHAGAENGDRPCGQECAYRRSCSAATRWRTNRCLCCEGAVAQTPYKAGTRCPLSASRPSARKPVSS